MRKFYAMLITMTFLALGGCSSIPEQNPNDPTIVQAKSFAPAPDGKGYVYLFRDTSFGGGEWLNTYMNDKRLFSFYGGDAMYNNTLNKSFFLLKLDAGKSYKFGTYSNGMNEMELKVESGKTYYIRLDPLRGALLSKSDLVVLTEQKDIEDAKKSIIKSIMNNPQE